MQEEGTMAEKKHGQHGRQQPRQGSSQQGGSQRNEPQRAGGGSPEDARRHAESGEPGGGAGRRDEVGGSGVYPASAQNAPADAELQNQASWGQGERGAAGYEDSGPSELYFYESELRAAEQAERGQNQQRGASQQRNPSEQQGEEPWGPGDHEGPGAAGLQPQPGDEVIGGGTSGADESPADERDAEQARRESEGRRGR
jgi:hypothetical protein